MRACRVGGCVCVWCVVRVVRVCVPCVPCFTDHASERKQDFAAEAAGAAALPGGARPHEAGGAGGGTSPLPLSHSLFHIISRLFVDRLSSSWDEQLARLDEKEKEVRKQQQNVVDFGAFCEEVVKRATNYFNIERLVTTHRKLAQGTLPLGKGRSWWWYSKAVWSVVWR